MEIINKLRPILGHETLLQLKPRLDEIESFETNKKKKIGFFADYGVGEISLTIIDKILSNEVLKPFVDISLEDIYFSITYGEGSPMVMDGDGNVTNIDSIRHDSNNVHQYKIHAFTKNQLLAKDDIEIVKLCPFEYEQRELTMFDAVIFCVSSLNALSVDNLQIMGQLHSFGAKEIFICFSQIEQIKQTEIERLFKYISSKLATSLPGVSYCFISTEDGYEPNGLLADYFGYDKISKWLNAIIEEGIRNDKREEISNYLAQDLIETAIQSMRQKLLPLEESRAQKYENFRTREQNVRFQQLAWEDLRIECEKRENDCVQIINDELSSSSQKVFDKLHLELISTQNPKEWWKNYLPLRLKIEIDSISTYIDNKLQNRLRTDQAWLNKELLSKFKSRAVDSPDASLDNPNVNVDIVPDADEMKDLRKYRYASMAGASALATAMYFIVGPVGAIVSAGCGILGDRMLTKEIAKQKSSLETSLRTLVDETFLKIKSLIPSKVHEVYESFIDTLDIKEDGWVKAHKIDSFTCSEDAEISNLNVIIEQLNDLK